MIRLVVLVLLYLRYVEKQCYQHQVTSAVSETEWFIHRYSRFRQKQLNLIKSVHLRKFHVNKWHSLHVSTADLVGTLPHISNSTRPLPYPDPTSSGGVEAGGFGGWQLLEQASARREVVILFNRFEGRYIDRSKSNYHYWP